MPPSNPFLTTGTGDDETPDEDDFILHLLAEGNPDDDLLAKMDEAWNDMFAVNPASLSKFDPTKGATEGPDFLKSSQGGDDKVAARDKCGGGGVPVTGDGDGDGQAVTGKVSGKRPPAPQCAADNDLEEDDSESELMTREVEKILSQLQVRDELISIGLEDERAEEEKDSQTRELEISAPNTLITDGELDSPTARTKSPTSQGPLGEQATGNSSGDPAIPAIVPLSSFSLPDAPASPLREIEHPEEGQKDSEKGENSNNSSSSRRKSFDFENDIITRMASLRGLSGSGSGITLDAFGLPVAPTFSPQDHQGTKTTRKKNMKKMEFKSAAGGGYTDADQKSWCIVCLDDATVRCIGCDDDVYCASCWRDMHIGPSAGYEERGHQRVKFVR